MFKLKLNLRHPMASMLTTDWLWLHRIAWGPRRVSSRAREGTKAYPGATTAVLGVWVAWIKKNWNRKTVYIVVDSDKEGHGARYYAELVAQATERIKANHRKQVMSELEDLQAQRAAARAAGDFALADELRDKLTAAGFVVADNKLEPRHD